MEALSQLVVQTMKELGIPDTQAVEMRERANVIVRHYTKGHHISFHIDEQECDSQVFGYVLQNEHPSGHGLVFRRGESTSFEFAFLLPKITLN